MQILLLFNELDGYLAVSPYKFTNNTQYWNKHLYSSNIGMVSTTGTHCNVDKGVDMKRL
jgi:hypothetical protein